MMIGCSSFLKLWGWVFTIFSSSTKRQEQTLHDFDVNALIVVEFARHPGPEKPRLTPSEAVADLRLEKGQEVFTVEGISIRRCALFVK